MEVGLYGKLPTHGDFLRRRVADDFIAAWDPWLQLCLTDSRTVLGEQWLETYLTSPVWRFAFSPHVCGAAAVAGLLVPSVDRVGRYFPFTLMWATPTDITTLEVATRFRRGFEHAERLLLDTLAADHFEFAEFDRRVMELSAHLLDVNDPGALRLTQESAAQVVRSLRPRCVPLRDITRVEAPAMQLLGAHLDASPGGVGFWWTEGSSVVEPSWLMTTGLPDPTHYSAMLDGDWKAAGWDRAETEIDLTATMVRPATKNISLHTVSAALTDGGPTRANNQDAFLERSDAGLWVVADGMGGLRNGELASRMVCDSLVDVAVAATIDEQVELIIEQLRQVNEYLRRAATREVSPVESGSTAVVLIIRGGECAMLWAGDSRVYRLREGLLSQMTTDHSWAANGGVDAEVITRAVGAEPTLDLDVVRSDVCAGDRFLLCSDGIGRVLDVGMLRHVLGMTDLAACCSTLVAQSIAQGGTDNMTAVVVECSAQGDPHGSE